MAVPSATVIQYYTGVLRLQPTAAQVTLYSNAADTATLLNVLETQALTQINPIIRLYQGAFNRVPDSGGLTFIAGQYANGPVGTTGAWSLTQISQNFCSSPEFAATYGSSTPVATTAGATAYISALYNNILGRVPATSEVAYWQAWTAAQLAAGTSAATVTAQLLTMFTESPEFIQSSAPYIQNFQSASAQGTETYTGTLWAQGVAETFTLTTGVDAPGFGAFAAGSPTGNSETMAILDNTAGTAGTQQTLNAYDQIQATGSNNTVNLVDAKGGSYMTAAQVSGIQTLNIRSGGAVGATAVGNFDVSGWTGLTAVNVTQSTGNDFLKVGANTAVTVNDTAGTVTVSGGSTQTVNTAGGVALSGASGAVTAVDTAQGDVNSTIDGGTNVSLTTTTTATTNYNGTKGTIVVGNSVKPTGTVTITENVTGLVGSDLVAGAITVNGGTVVNITENATQPVAANDTTNKTLTQSAVTVNGSTATTAVVINETAAATKATGKTAVTGVNAVKTVTFADLAAGNTTTVGYVENVSSGLTFTAAATLSAAQVAQAFANLANGAINGGVSTTVGKFSGSLSGWTSGSATSNAVTFTSTTQTGNQSLAATKTVSGTPSDLTQSTVTAGVTEVTAVTAVGGIAAGNVVILDANYASGTAAGTITTVTVNNYEATSAAGSGKGLVISDNNLSTLNATNGGSITINNASSLTTKPATTLALNISGVSGEFADSNVYTTINVTTGANASTLAKIKDTALTTLNVAGSSALTVTSSTDATALKTINVSGSAGLTGSFIQNTLTAINASGTSGNNTITMDASKATYTGGTGVDAVTTAESVTSVSKAIDLGAGNDTLVLADGVQTVSAAIAGGLGNDTISMLAADAAVNAASSQFVINMSGFEAVRLRGATGSQTVDLGLLALAQGSSTINSNVFAGATGGEGGTLTLKNFANNGTLTIDGTQDGTIALTNTTAWTGTGTANVTLLDTKTGATGNPVTGGIVSVDGASTVNIVTSQVATAINADTLTIKDVGSTDYLATINVTGNSNLTLTGDSGNGVLTAVNATGMTGALTYTALGTKAQTVTGGNGNDVLAAHTTMVVDSQTVPSTVADTLIGGAGNDTLTTNAGLTTLTGGAGNDTFVAAVANTATSYSTITDFSVGDHLQMAAKGTATFASTKITLASTATFLEYLNEAAKGDATTNAKLSWFQFGGNTYVVEDLTNTGSFAATDIVVGLTGLVDLSNAALSLNGETPVPTLTLFA